MPKALCVWLALTSQIALRLAALPQSVQESIGGFAVNGRAGVKPLPESQPS